MYTVPKEPDAFKRQLEALYDKQATQLSQMSCPPDWLKGACIVVPFLLFIPWMLGAMVLADLWGEWVPFVAFIIFAFGFLAPLNWLNGKQLKYWEAEVRKEQLSTLLYLLDYLQADLHPQFGLKGVLDLAGHLDRQPYRSKISRSGKRKSFYYRYCWADLQFRLLDGSLLRLRFEDKYKLKSGAVERELRLQRGSLAYNTVLFSPSPQANTRITDPQSYLVLEPAYLRFRFRYGCPGSLNQLALGVQTALASLQMAKSARLQLVAKASRPSSAKSMTHSKLSTSSSQPPTGQNPDLQTSQQTPATAASATSSAQLAGDSSAAAKGQWLVFVSKCRLRPRIQVQRASGMQVSCQGELIQVEAVNRKGEAYLNFQLATPYLDHLSPEQLLRANPHLAHARLGRDAQQQTWLFSSLLLETLDQIEFDACLQELLQLSQALRLQPEPPQRLRPHKQPVDSINTLLNQVLQPLDALREDRERRSKITLTLSSGRRQKIYLRSDRADAFQRPLLCMNTFVQDYTGQDLQPLLADNLQPGYGSRGLLRKGDKEYVVLSATQLQQSADAAELENMLIRLAAAGDKLERAQSGADRF